MTSANDRVGKKANFPRGLAWRVLAYAVGDHPGSLLRRMQDLMRRRGMMVYWAKSGQGQSDGFADLFDLRQRRPFSPDIECHRNERHPAPPGETHLHRLLTLFLVWTAALALPLAAAPAAFAQANAPPCPMEASGVTAADLATMDCCDHGDGGSEQTSCKPGMACFATVAAIPAASVDIATIALGGVDPFQAPIRALASRPPDRDIRPPIRL